MNIRNITTTNAKGQIVIPQKIREKLSIDSEVLLSVTIRGKGIYVYPVKDIITHANRESSYDHILRRTQGAWSSDSYNENRREVKQRKLELALTEKRKTSW